MSITITIPLVGEELRQTAQMLLDLANLRASRDSGAAVVTESKPTTPPAPPVATAPLAPPTPEPPASPLKNPSLTGDYSGPMAGAALVPPVPPAPPLSGPGSVAPNYSGAQSGGYVPAPPVAAAPVAPLTPPAPPTAGPELDGEGLPWDKRIHASTKTRRQSDNTWKLTRGVDDATVAAVKAELRQTMAAGPAPVAVTPPAVPTAPAPESAAFWPGEPAAPVAPTPAAPPTYGAMCEWMVAKVSSGAFTKDHVKDAFATVGLPTIPSLENREDLIPQIYQALCAVEAAGVAA